MVDFNKMKLQKDEFSAALKFAEAVRVHSQVSVIADDYPEIRHRYEGELRGFIKAMAANGRFNPGPANQYGVLVPAAAPTTDEHNPSVAMTGAYD